MREMMTAEQAAKYFQVSKQTLANWEKSGKIDTYRIGGIVRYIVNISITKENSNAKNN